MARSSSTTRPYIVPYQTPNAQIEVVDRRKRRMAVTGAKQRSRNTFWTEAEDAKLCVLGARFSVSALRREFPGRSEGSIRLRAKKLGFKAPRGECPAHVRYRGHLPPAPLAHPFVRKLIEAANQQQTLLGEIAERAGVDYEAMTKWRYQTTPRLASIIACLNVLGLDLAVVPLKEAI